MRKFDLLEKFEVYQIELLMYLIDAGGSATKKDLLDHLDISKYFFTKLIESLISLAQKSDTNFSIEMNRQNVLLKTRSEYSLYTLYNVLIKHAPKYQILEELFLHGTINPRSLCKKIGLSQSTYFRKINELNNLLEEFDLTIQKGVLLGSELQIRFFYMSLCLITNLEEKVTSSNIDPRILTLVNTIQQLSGSSFSFSAKKKLIIYFCLLKRRYVQKCVMTFNQHRLFFYHQIDSHSQKKFIHALKKTPLFKQIHIVLKSFLVYYSFEMHSDEEILLLLFMIAEEMIPNDSTYLNKLNLIETNNHFFVRSLSTELFNFIEQHYPNTGFNNEQRGLLHYYLKSSIYHHLIFRGHIDYHWKPQWDNLQPIKKLDHFTTFLKQKYSGILINEAHDTILITKISNIVSFYEDHSKERISVGIFFEGDFLYKNKFTEWWIKHIELTSIALAEPLSSNKSYDLIISNVNYPQLQKRGRYFYFLTNYQEKLDIINLDYLLNDLYSSNC